MNRITHILGIMIWLTGFSVLVAFLFLGCGGGSDDKSASDNVSYTTNCTQEITINVQSPDEVQEGDKVEEGYIANILKVESNEQGVDITATVCSSEDNDSASTNVQGEVDVEASLLPQ